MTADLIVIGGGIIGCAVARRAGREGRRVLVVDRDVDRRHASWAAAGMLAPLGESHGPGDFLSLLLQARALYPDYVRDLEDETGLDLGYRTEGMLLLAFDDDGERALDRRRQWQEEAGLAVETLSPREVLGLESAVSPRLRSGLLFRDDHQIENRALHLALQRSAERAGAAFRLGLPARVVRSSEGALTVELDSGERLLADRVVVAAGSWSGKLGGLPRPLPIEPIRGQIMGVRNLQPPIRHILASSRGYLVPRSDGRVIVGATGERAGYDASTTPAGLRQLTSIAEAIAPDLIDQPLLDHWAGLRPGTPDGLPILGPDPDLPDLIYATGHFRNGILLAPITGEIIGGMAAGLSPGIDLTPYRPDRFSGNGAASA